MRHRLIVMAALTSLFLFGCQAAETAEPSVENSPTAEAVVVSEAAPAATLPPASDYCLECHTDQEKLTSLATKEEDAHDSESEGVG